MIVAIRSLPAATRLKHHRQRFVGNGMVGIRRGLAAAKKSGLGGPRLTKE
jgi:hypothetical protein